MRIYRGVDSTAPHQFKKQKGTNKMRKFMIIRNWDNPNKIVFRYVNNKG